MLLCPYGVMVALIPFKDLASGQNRVGVMSSFTDLLGGRFSTFLAL